MKKKRLLVWSVDAMVTEDLEYLRTCKNFSAFLEGVSGCESVETIYPSVTYPVHVSLQTGCYPDKTGVFCNNTFVVNGGGVDWCWDSRLIRCENIFTAAKRAGYTTGAVSWPVTAYNRDIDYHLPEYWLAHPGDTFEGSFAEMGANEDVIRMMQRHSHRLPPTFRLTGKENFAREPEFDAFMLGVACDLIREKKPEVMFLHSSLIDAYRHQNGIFNAKVTEGLDLVDTWLGMLCDALKEARTFEDTNIVVLSDHGQQDIVRIVKPNAYLAERGFIRLDSDGKVTDYTVYGISNGMSMYFWLKDPQDKAAYDAVHKTLREMADDGIWGFTQVFTRQEAAERLHLDGDFDFIIESDGYTSFTGLSCVRPLVSQMDLKDYRMGRAVHGYLPDNGPQPVFMARGPDIRPNVMLPRRHVVDAAPTFAALLGFELPEAQGSCMKELLK